MQYRKLLPLGNHYFGEFSAYCNETRGIALIIDSTAEGADVDIENINFFSHLKK